MRIYEYCNCDLFTAVILTRNCGLLLQYDNVMLHTSFARLLGRPNTYPKEVDQTFELKFFDELVTRANNQLSGFQVDCVKLLKLQYFVIQYAVQICFTYEIM